jgi:hypothetical protein
MKLFAISLKHIKRVLKHKWYVFIYCKKIGIPFHGFMHDWSKFTPTEFLESIRNYDECVSPIVVAKKRKGYSEAWQHHKGRNPHHYEYWVDIGNGGVTPIQMPIDDAIELICDYLAAGRTYMGDKFSYAAEFDWWDRIKRPTIKHIHPQTKYFIDLALFRMQNENWQFNKPNLIGLYKIAESTVRERERMRQSRN